MRFSGNSTVYALYKIVPVLTFICLLNVLFNKRWYCYRRQNIANLDASELNSVYFSQNNALGMFCSGFKLLTHSRGDGPAGPPRSWNGLLVVNHFENYPQTSTRWTQLLRFADMAYCTWCWKTLLFYIIPVSSGVGASRLYVSISTSSMVRGPGLIVILMIIDEHFISVIMTLHLPRICSVAFLLVF